MTQDEKHTDINVTSKSTPWLHHLHVPVQTAFTYYSHSIMCHSYSSAMIILRQLTGVGSRWCNSDTRFSYEFFSPIKVNGGSAISAESAWSHIILRKWHWWVWNQSASLMIMVGEESDEVVLWKWMHLASFTHTTFAGRRESSYIQLLWYFILWEHLY